MRIAVYGKIRSGKSSVCEHIKNKYDYEVIEFSHALQRAVDIMYPEHIGTKNRELLIGVGQHMRKFDENVWVNCVKRRIENSENENILVAGVRQQNEYDMLKELGFKFIEVEASKDMRIERCKATNDAFKEETLENDTEKLMSTFDSTYSIMNDKGLDELKQRVDIVMYQLQEDEKKREMEKAFVKDANVQYLHKVYKKKGRRKCNN